MSEDEFTKLFKYVEEMRSEMNARLDETITKQQLSDLTKTIDGLAGFVRDYHQKMRGLTHGIDGSEKWINQIAAKTGVKLEY